MPVGQTERVVEKLTAGKLSTSPMGQRYVQQRNIESLRSLQSSYGEAYATLQEMRQRRKKEAAKALAKVAEERRKLSYSLLNQPGTPRTSELPPMGGATGGGRGAPLMFALQRMSFGGGSGVGYRIYGASQKKSFKSLRDLRSFLRRNPKIASATAVEEFRLGGTYNIGMTENELRFLREFDLPVISLAQSRKMRGLGARRGMRVMTQTGVRKGVRPTEGSAEQTERERVIERQNIRARIYESTLREQREIVSRIPTGTRNEELSPAQRQAKKFIGAHIRGRGGTVFNAILGSGYIPRLSQDIIDRYKEFQ